MSYLTSPITCELFETNVSDYVDRTLAANDRTVMDTHLSQCPACRALHVEVGAIVTGAARLPQLSPSRDLWSGIAERLDTPVVSIGTTGSHAVRATRFVSFRMFAAAAMLIVALSSRATYLLTHVSSVEGTTTPVASTQPAPSSVIPAPGMPVNAIPASALANAGSAGVAPSRATTRGTKVATTNQAPEAVERTRSRYASNDGSVERVYEREIMAMRRIVDERIGDLDSVTVFEIERNLRIIDKAINDSRRALQNDPRSRFLSSQLDRALETKLGVLRRIALL